MWVTRVPWEVPLLPAINKVPRVYLDNGCSADPQKATVVADIVEFRMPTPQDVWKKGSKILKLPRFATVLH
jgi:hypothetical protein